MKKRDQKSLELKVYLIQRRKKIMKKLITKKKIFNKKKKKTTKSKMKGNYLFLQARPMKAPSKALIPKILLV